MRVNDGSDYEYLCIMQRWVPKLEKNKDDFNGAVGVIWSNPQFKDIVGFLAWKVYNYDN